MEVKPGYKQTEVGVIPEDWEVLALKQISPSQSVGLVINPSSYFDQSGSVPMLVGSNISPNSIDWSKSNRITEESNINLPASRIYEGDLVVVRVGDPGVAAVVPPELHGCNCASMMIVRKSPQFVSAWLCAIFNSAIGESRIEGVQYGTAQKQFNISDAVEFKFPVPALLEQRAIAAALSDVDAALAGILRLIAKKRDLKQAAMQTLLSGRTRLPGFTGEWQAKRLGAFGATYGGLTGKVGSDFGIGSNHYITFMNVMANVEIDPEIFDNVIIGPNEHQNTVRRGDLIFNGSSETADEVAMCAFVPFDLPRIFLNSFCFGFRAAQERIDGLFMAYLYRSNVGREIVKFLAQGSTRINISKRALLDAEIRLPEKSEQTAIAAVLSDMDAEIAALTATADKTRLLKQAMMQELLTGRTRLPLPE